MTGSWDSRTFKVTNTFCYSGPHLSCSDVACRAHLYAPFFAFPADLERLIGMFLVRSDRGWAMHA